MGVWIIIGVFIGTILATIFLNVGEMKVDPTLLDHLWFIAFTFGTPLVASYLAFRESEGS